MRTPSSSLASRTRSIVLALFAALRLPVDSRSPNCSSRMRRFWWPIILKVSCIFLAGYCDCRDKKAASVYGFPHCRFSVLPTGRGSRNNAHAARLPAREIFFRQAGHAGQGFCMLLHFGHRGRYRLAVKSGSPWLDPTTSPHLATLVMRATQCVFSISPDRACSYSSFVSPCAFRAPGF